MVACSTPCNAKGVMKAAIRSEKQIVLFEHHLLLYNLETIPDEEYILSLGEAGMLRPRERVTIPTYFRMRYHIMQAAKTLVNKGYKPEDCPWLPNFDNVQDQQKYSNSNNTEKVRIDRFENESSVSSLIRGVLGVKLYGYFSFQPTICFHGDLFASCENLFASCENLTKLRMNFGTYRFKSSYYCNVAIQLIRYTCRFASQLNGRLEQTSCVGCFFLHSNVIISLLHVMSSGLRDIKNK